LNPELDNASRAMGFDRFNFYMQIRPIDENNFNVSSANKSAIEIVGDKGDVASVVRYSILNYDSFGDFDGAYLLGKDVPTKALFGIQYEDLSVVRNGGGLSFSIYNWTIATGKTGNIQNIQIDDEVSKKGDSVNTQDKLDGTEFNISIWMLQILMIKLVFLFQSQLLMKLYLIGIRREKSFIFKQISKTWM
jgi:hypothetical protein